VSLLSRDQKRYETSLSEKPFVHPSSIHKNAGGPSFYELQFIFTEKNEQQLFTKIKKGNAMVIRNLIPIKTIIATSFFMTLLLVVICLTGFTYYINSKSALKTAEQLMESTSNQIYMKIENMYEPLVYLVNQAGSLPSVAVKPSLQTHPAEAYMLNAMRIYKQVQIQYIGFQDGDFYCIYSLNSGYKGAREHTHAPDDAAFAVLRQYTPEGQSSPVRFWRYLNDKGQTIGSFKESDVSYDPRKRIWYTTALEEEGIIKSLPYKFDNAQELGITVAIPIDGSIPGVYGVDILLSEISHYLEEIKNSSSEHIIIFNKDLQITAAPVSMSLFENDRQTLLSMNKDPLLTMAAKVLKKQGLSDNMTLTLKIGRESYLVKVMAIIDSFKDKEYVLIAVSIDDILEPLAINSAMNIMHALLLFLFSIPLIVFIATKISHPIKDLAKEAEIIYRHDFSRDIEIFSGIKEINELAEEMAIMKRGLRHFNKYVPSRLVTYLLKHNKDITIGGINKEITVMFTDIADFTRISENCPPELLMQQLSWYFDKIANIIRRNNGLVDKYIGDAVMAIWNAPQDDPEHIKNACTTAIEIRKEMHAFALEQEAKGEMAFHTRVGIDTGIAVVGNVGSSDRMNYTVIGDIVNNASRLEGVNKLYKTDVLISQKIAERLNNDFLLKPIAKVIVKGKTKEQLIYELLEKTSIAKASAILHTEKFHLGLNLYYNRNWPEAMKAFQQADKLEKNHNSQNYIKLCRQMIKNPPGKDWSGIRVIRQK